jgi:hypothetical protein
MGASLLTIGLVASRAGWPAPLMTPLLFAGGAGRLGLSAGVDEPGAVNPAN